MPIGAGAIVAVRVLSPDGKWLPLYTGTPLHQIGQEYTKYKRYWRWSPSVCRPHFKTKTIRLELDTSTETGIAGANCVDYVRVFGADSLQPAAVPSSSGGARIRYVPDANAHGLDSFSYHVSDCPGDRFRSSTAATISLTISPVNDIPVAQALTLNISASDTLHAVDLGRLVSDADVSLSDADASLNVTIDTLPSMGELYDGAERILRVPHLVKSADAVIHLLVASNSSLHDGVRSTVVDSRSVVLSSLHFSVVDAEGARDSGEVLLRIMMVSCPRGMELVGSSCQWCAPGTFKAAADSSRCSFCSPGTVQPTEGGTSCDACPAGWAQVSSGSIVCNQCTPGTYQPANGSAQCHSCDAGSYMPGFGATACILCPMQQQQPAMGAISCKPCDRNTNSTPGAATCLSCVAGTYRASATVPASSSTCDPCDGPFDCPPNSTTETLVLRVNHWRHSDKSAQVWPCRLNGGWTPCRGGASAGDDGDGYCTEGYRGPRCELCNGTAAHSHYFSTLDSRCHECGDVISQSTAFFSAVLFLFFAAVAGVTAIMRRKGPLSIALQRRLQEFHRIWQRAGVRYKIKLTVGLYQCIAAVASVFDVSTPQGAHEYAKWLNLLEVPADLGIDVVIPASCVGSYRSRLFL
eukprot:4087942-Prymnesium_polylepis.1